MRKLSLLTRMAIVVAVLSFHYLLQSQSTPNVIFILADDLGYGDLGCYGQKKITTPHIDLLASEGLKFTQFYSGSTVCAPSRSSLMTGQHTGHTRVRGNKPAYLFDSDVTVAEIFKSKSYATGCIGKWGIGEIGTPGHPNLQGFDYFYGYLNQLHAHTYYTDFLIRNTDTVHLDGQTYSHDLLTQEALQFIGEQKDTNFFLYLPYTIPHTKFQVPELGKYADSTSWSDNQRKQAAMISRLDRDVGRIMDTLELLGIADSTLVIFTSDNGPHGKSGTNTLFDANGSLRGIKRDLYEGGVRVPFIAVWPGKIAQGETSDYMGAFWDFLPTCADLINVDNVDSIDGISFVPALLDSKAKTKHEFLYWEFHEKNGRQAIRMGDWKGVRHDVFDAPNTPIELYDLKTDLAEKNNIAGDYPTIVNKIDFKMKSERSYNPLFDFGYGNQSLTKIDIYSINGHTIVPINDTLHINYYTEPLKVHDRRCKWKVLSETPGVTASFTSYGELISDGTEGTVKLVAQSVFDTVISDTLEIQITNKTTLITNEILGIGGNNIKVSADIINVNGTIGKVGFCYGNHPNPDLEEGFKESVVTGDQFSDTILDLPYDQTIYVRAVIITTKDTAYGNNKEIVLHEVDFDKLRDNVVFYLPLDGSFKDHSVNNHTMKAGGDPQFNNRGMINQCLNYDGTNDYIQSPANVLNPATSDFTFCAWIKCEDDATGRVILQQENGSGTGRSILFLNPSTKSFANYFGGGTNSFTNTYTNNKWHHVALIGKQNGVQLFVDGKADKELNVMIENATGAFNIGRHKIGQLNDKTWKGQLDEVYMFDTVLTTKEIAALKYQVPFSSIDNTFIENQLLGFKLYPNPQQNGQSVQIRIESINSTEVNILITNVMGQIVYRADNIRDKIHSVLLDAGVYLVIVSNEQTMVSQKLLVR